MSVVAETDGQASTFVVFDQTTREVSIMTVS
jgi:hypothetical protein